MQVSPLGFHERRFFPFRFRNLDPVCVQKVPQDNRASSYIPRSLYHPRSCVPKLGASPDFSQSWSDWHLSSTPSTSACNTASFSSFCPDAFHSLCQGLSCRYASRGPQGGDGETDFHLTTSGKKLEG